MSSDKILMGGHKQKDPEDQEIKELLSKAITIHNSKSNDENILVVKIVEATSQGIKVRKSKIMHIGREQEHIEILCKGEPMEIVEEYTCLGTVISRNKKVVAGMKYKLTFVGEGDTSKKQYNCVAEVLSQPWISPEPQLLSMNLTPL